MNPLGQMNSLEKMVSGWMEKLDFIHKEMIKMKVSKIEVETKCAKLEEDKKELERDLEELKNHCNTVWGLVKKVLPFCPAKMKKMIIKAEEDGRNMKWEVNHKNDRLVEAINLALPNMDKDSKEAAILRDAVNLHNHGSMVR